MNANQAVEILLVEDNPHDAELTLIALRKNRISNHIFVARDGAEAIDFIFGQGDFEHRKLEQLPRIILLDLKLPKINGLEVLERLKSNEKTRKIPVTILTSSKEELDIARSYELGVNSYIVKPVDFEKFLKAISDLGFYWLLLNQAPH